MEVKPLKSDSGPTVRQPKAPFRSLPCSSLLVGPSGSGKSVVLIRTLMDKDKLGGLFDRYEIFSPNVFTDPQYRDLIKYVEGGHTNQKREDFCHTTFDQGFIKQMMEDMRKSNAYLRKQGAKRLLSACIVIDDMGEDERVIRNHASVVQSLFTRGRHVQISTFLCLQRFMMASPNLRYNTHNLYVHRLNSSQDLEKLAENFAEVTHGKENFVAIYRQATKKPYGFLFITMGSTPRFYSSYNSEFKISEEEDL